MGGLSRAGHIWEWRRGGMVSWEEGRVSGKWGGQCNGSWSVKWEREDSKMGGESHHVT